MKNYLAIISAAGIVTMAEALSSPDISFEEDKSSSTMHKKLIIDLGNDLLNEEMQDVNGICYNGSCGKD
ncbi:MAG: hypothetical protein BGO77_04395 [Caedibacter sp. 37-49]|mgnify:CR=1 FL=1|nr:MAG: hypothetical protein BGO77_04395 [Caedibacter sp. 37-49]